MASCFKLRFEEGEGGQNNGLEKRQEVEREREREREGGRERKEKSTQKV